MHMVDLADSARRRDEITLRRLDEIVPALMRRHEVDCWVLVSREYAEDAVAQTMLPARWLSSRRRTILVFLQEAADHRRVAINRYEVDGMFPLAWDPGSGLDQWQALATMIEIADPDTIAVSTSDSFAHADGLSATERDHLLDALGPSLSDRVVSGEELAIGWLHTRLPEERAVLEEGCARSHSILRRALSREAIVPGSTTTADLEWWLRGQVQGIGCPVWFHPAASVQRQGLDLRGSFSSATRPVTIEAGDLVHIDFGLVWDHLCTDQQQQGYVLRAGESHAPDGLQSAMQSANRLQDLLLEEILEGRTGNEVLESTLARARRSGLDPMVYSHPIGYHGHGAGATIGLWDRQGGVPGPGDVVIVAPSAWSIELLNRQTVPEWGGDEVAIMLEEEAWLEGGAITFVDGRQTEIWEI